MQLELSQINEILSDISGIRYGKKGFDKFRTDVIKSINGEYSDQGQEGLSYEIYETPITGLLIKMEITTDSYGDNEKVISIQFGEPKEKTVTDFEPIK